MTENVTRHEAVVTAESRKALLGGDGCTVLFTGLSGSGKSTLAYEVEKLLIESGRAAYVLDGDNLRLGLNGDLGFSPEDRAENVRRVTEVACLMAEAGLVALVPLIAPYNADREAARARHGARGVKFIEVFVDTPLEVCEERDPKGLYARARAGEIKDMTGIDAPYERPKNPELHLDSSGGVTNSALDKVIELVAGVGHSGFSRIVHKAD
ncbi:MAG TPA: adenylyl-sulfate kinase [Acidimicrobiia bacterium]